MAKEKSIGITVKKDKDIAEWYQQVCIKAEVADYAPVKGCMILRPLAYHFWQTIMDDFNKRLKKNKVKNAYFPIFIPESFFKKEAEHAKGFKPEVAWIANRDEGSDRLALRPTSETIMYDSYSKWIRSWRDLPLKINQWANVIRWETKATKLFLRSREFLWQEGHCVYETEKERNKETIIYLKEYQDLVESLLAVPLMVGRKSEKEKFAGADATYAIEAFMPDGKALQMGTSHNLSQGFAKVFGINFLGKDKKEHLPFQNSWGISTRLIGGMIMVHSDDKGLVIPPRMAPNKLVIIPIIFDKTADKVNKKAKEIEKELKALDPILDDRDDYTPGWKYNEWELKGVPLRLELGPKDYEKKHVVIVRRDNGKKEFIKWTDLKKKIPELLEKMQKDLYEKAKKQLDDAIVDVKDFKHFIKAIKDRKIVKTVFCGEVECEDEIKFKADGATSRCAPLENEKAQGKCIHCGKEAKYNMFFSKSY